MNHNAVYESGKSGNKTIMLLPGNMMTYRQYERVISVLADKYHVIAVSFDGFDETGETTYTTAQDQAQKLAVYIRERLGGRVDLVLSESLGGAPAAYLTRHTDISIGGLIMDGASYWNLGVLNPIAKATLYKIPYGIVKKAEKSGKLSMPEWLLKSMGLTQEKIDELTHQMCLSVSAETLKATFVEGIELYISMENWEARTDIPVACWYGEKESNMKKAVKVMKKAFPKVQVQAFPEMGHGELVTHAERFVREMEGFMLHNAI